MFACNIITLLAFLLYTFSNFPEATTVNVDRRKIPFGTYVQQPKETTTTQHPRDEETVTLKNRQQSQTGDQSDLRLPAKSHTEEPLRYNISQVTTESSLRQQSERRVESRTEERLDLPHTAGSIQILLQRINDRLTTIEALQNQQLRKLDTIDYRITRLEVLSQEKRGEDKSDEHVSRKIENMEWEINKYGTLLDVIRQDLDKIHQRQTELKVALSSNAIQSLVSSRSSSAADRSDADDPAWQTAVPTDTPQKLQTIANQVQQIRKMADTLQIVVYGLGRNLTDVNNMTRILYSNSQQTLTKQYFNIAMKEILALQQVPSLSIHTCTEPEGEKQKSDVMANDCADMKQQGHNKSGIYRIKPRGVPEPIFVYCDMESDGGGWTVIQKRLDGTVNFYREWPDYKYGFGNVAGEYWLGNENIYHITKKDIYQLKIELEDFDGIKASADYSSFALGSEKDAYMIKLLGNYAGDAGDSLTYHASVKFSTKDMDNDHWEGGNCAETHTGGWWYKGCDMANLNGQYLGGEIPESMHYQGVYWYEWHGPDYSLHKTVMKIRPATFRNKTIVRKKE